MSTTTTTETSVGRPGSTDNDTTKLDAIVIGAGFGGIYALYKLRDELGLTVRAFEKGGGIGGTWYFNRYPGAKSDTEGFVYRYSFDKELLQDYDWSTRYLEQEDILEYLNHVVDRFDLRRDIQLDTEVVGARFDEDRNLWVVRTSSGEEHTARYLVNGLGLLAKTNMPDIPGRDSFAGVLVHTNAWPEDLDITGKRVGVIGTGSTGTQFIVAAPKIAAHLTVFQRSPQYCVPSGNGPVDPAEVERTKQNFDAIWDQVRNSVVAFGFEESGIEAASVSEEERSRIFQENWDKGNGFRFMFGTFNDIATNPESNEAAAAFIRNKIHEIVKDPETARKLTPTEMYAKRPLCNEGYYETFNRDNVTLVSVKENPIQAITPRGVLTADGVEHELDVLVFATGFDAVDGNYRSMDLRGRGGKHINEHWGDTPTSYLGVTTARFPNMFMILGPNGPFTNLPPSIETQVEFITDLVRSWRRSIGAGAHRDPGAMTFINEFDTDSELCRAAHPVLDRLEATLQDMGTAIFLADRTGQIVARRAARSQRTRFDNAYAAEGFDFSEETIGTNGLGTAIQEDAPVFVRGPEHFNDALQDLACAGIGIRHPATGRVIGSLSLSAPADAAEMMMLAMAREGARQIVDNLSSTVGRRELALGRTYQRHRTKGPVIVLNSDTVMTNVTGLSFLNVEMHARLWDALLAQDWAQGPHVLDLDLQALHARVLAHRLDDADEASFAVEIIERKRPAAPSEQSRPALVHDPFVRNLQRAARRRPGTLSVTGPSGAGKLHIVREWLATEGYAAPLVLDAGDLQSRDSWRREASATLESGTPVVLRRLEDVDARQLRVVRALADGMTPDGPAYRPARLVVTADLSRCSPAVLRMLGQVAAGIELPPLAGRRQEIPSIARSVLAAIEPRERPVLSAAAMQVLLRWDWPGNVAELRQVLLGLATELPGRSVSPGHLPEHMWDAANRRRLTRMESAERTEIIAALRQSGGNRSKAASLLGIGRTTLYRKLHALGIDDEALLS